MVKLAINSKHGMDSIDPNIFSAAYNDDPVELEAAINAGQSLDLVDSMTGYTPVHIACINKGINFLGLALKLQFNPWAMDLNQRLPIDHAYAQGLRDIHAALLSKMYPNTPHGSNVSAFPPSEP